MKRIFILLTGLTLIFFFHVAALAFDPPHNEASGVACGDCHGRSLTSLRDQQDNPIDNPFWDDITTAEAYNAICRRCHLTETTIGDVDGYGGESAPAVQSHAPNETPIKCTTCHDNHEQKQINSGTFDTDNFFIARGTKDIGRSFQFITSGSQITKTVIPYSALSATNASGNWAYLDNLPSKTNLNRGNMLVPSISDRSSRWPVYMIDSVDTGADTITVKGEVISASDFGIFYGQLIRNMMLVDNNLNFIDFYDKADANSFVSLTPPYGICQVCHENQGALTGIQYWRNDGTGTSHNTEENCMGCHLHRSGINHNGSNDCSTCHDDHHSTSNANASVGNCEYCHADPRPSMVFWDDLLTGDNGNNYGTFVPTQMACKECHISFSGGSMIVTKFSRTDYDTFLDAYSPATVHTINNADLASLGQINNYGICLSCHNGQIATAVRVWHARPDVAGSGKPGAWVMNQNDERQCTGTREAWDPRFAEPEGWALNAPGRTGGQDIGNFNLFQSPGFGYIPQVGPPGCIDCDPCTDWEDYLTPGTPWSFTRIAIPAVPGNGNTSGSVPVFPSLCPKTPAGEECPPVPPPPDVTNTFNYTGSAQTFSIPANATNILITVKGAGGGGGRPSSEGLQTIGQSGSKVTLPYGNPGVTLTIYVGEGGKMGSLTTTGAPGGWGYPSSGSKGGDGEDNGEDWAYGGAGGGGASSVYYGGAKLAVTRGGSGGRSDDWLGFEYMVGGAGGAGGGSNYYPSGTLYPTGGGSGGTTAPTNGGNGQITITYNLPP